MLNFWDSFGDPIAERAGKATTEHGLDLKSLDRSKVKTYKEADVVYRFNDYGFRSNEFANISKDDSLLFVGCSITEGIGLPYEHIWSNQLTQLINQDGDKQFKAFNMSLAGTGLDTMSRNLYVLIKKLEKVPHSVFLLIPPLYRMETFVSEKLEDDEYVYFFNPFNKRDSNNKFWHDKKTANLNIRERFHDAYGQLVYLQDFLEARGVKLYISIWDFGEYRSGEKRKIDFFKENLPSSLKKDYLESEFKKTSTSTAFPQEIAKDLFHPGPNSHFDFAVSVYNELLKREQ